MNRNPRRENLVQNRERTKEQVVEAARKAAKASAVARRDRKMLRETLLELLALPMDEGAVNESVTSLKGFSGRGVNASVRSRIMLAMVSKAAKGDVKAAEFIRDTIGEKPTEVFEDATPRAPVVLGMIPLDRVEKAKAERAGRRRADGERADG